MTQCHGRLTRKIKTNVTMDVLTKKLLNLPLNLRNAFGNNVSLLTIQITFVYQNNSPSLSFPSSKHSSGILGAFVVLVISGHQSYVRRRVIIFVESEAVFNVFGGGLGRRLGN